MILNVIVDEQTFPIDVPDSMLSEAENFFQKMDADMAKGWQMSRQWVESPNVLQCCQIAGDKLLTAIEQENQPMIGMMAGYILKRMPGIKSIRLDTTGDMNQTEVEMAGG